MFHKNFSVMGIPYISYQSSFKVPITDLSYFIKYLVEMDSSLSPQALEELLEVHILWHEVNILPFLHVLLIDFLR